MFFLQSERLKLLPLEHTNLLLFLQNRARLEQNLGLEISNPEIRPWENNDFMNEIVEAMEHYVIPRVAQNPDHWQWFTHWLVVHRADNLTIGGIGANGLPDENGETMIGYYIDQKYEGQGFASEAVKIFVDWLFDEPTLKAVIADTPEAHVASQKVLIRNGFMHAGAVEEGTRWRHVR